MCVAMLSAFGSAGRSKIESLSVGRTGPAALLCIQALLSSHWEGKAVAADQITPPVWTACSPLPDRQGWAGMVAGVSHGVLIAGGGANFPAAPPWEGGKKVYSNQLFALETPQGSWKLLPSVLPFQMGYAVTTTYGDRVIVAGGERVRADGAGTEASSDCFALTWNEDSVEITTLPSLPKPLMNAAGAIVGDHLYVAGGIASPTATQAEAGFYRLNLAELSQASRWEELSPLPTAGRMLSVAASADGAFYLFGGVSLSADAQWAAQRQTLTDAFAYHPTAGWKSLAELPHAITAAPSPAPVVAGHVLLMGGDDGTQAAVPASQRQGFPARIQAYSVSQNEFHSVGTLPAPRVTAPVTHWNGSWQVVSGELRPGVRSPEVWSLSLQIEDARE